MSTTPIRLLLFSDLHASRSAAEALVSKAAGADVLVGAGDFGNARRQIGVCIDILSAINKPAILVPGNNESTEELAAACRGWPWARVLHGSATTVRGISFFGLGGGVPVTPFGSWSFDLSEDEASRLLAPCPGSCVLVSHSPPRGFVDRSSRGGNLGSTAVLKTIMRTAPLLVVCGHIHGSAGQIETVGVTPVINAGPDGIVWTLGV